MDAKAFIYYLQMIVSREKEPLILTKVATFSILLHIHTYFRYFTLIHFACQFRIEFEVDHENIIEQSPLV